MKILSFGVLLLLSISIAPAQSTGFTYQGRLATGGTPAQGNFDFIFELYDQPTGGTQQGPTITREPLGVISGAFSIQLDFGDVFTGGARYLEISVRPAGTGSYETLAPRQQITSSPYAVRALNTDTATNATQLGGVSAADFVITTDPRMTDAREPVPGSAGYIQNTTTTQDIANFNINGDGRARFFDATDGFRINGTRILTSTSGPSTNLYIGPSAGPAVNNGGDNIFVGRFAGNQNAGGVANTFVGVNSGYNNTLGDTNAFFGYNSGRFNTSGDNNAFFGSSAGNRNEQGFANSNFGTSAGSQNVSGAHNANFGNAAGFFNNGSSNSVFGSEAGRSNTTGSSNAFFGRDVAGAMTVGNENAYFGAMAGRTMTSGTRNSFFGFEAGIDRNGTNMTMIGALTRATADNLSFATAIGAGATVGTSNTIALGRPGGEDTVRVPGTLDANGTMSANIVNAVTQYNIGGNRVFSISDPGNTFVGVMTGPDNTGSANSFFGGNAGHNNTSGVENSFFGRFAGSDNNTGSKNSFFGFGAGANANGGGNTFIGYQAGASNDGTNNTAIGFNAGGSENFGTNNTYLGAGADSDSGVPISFATAIGSGAIVTTSNTISIGRSLDDTVVNGDLKVEQILRVDGFSILSGRVTLSDKLQLDSLGIAGTLPLCFNLTSEVAQCASSMRFKENVTPYRTGLDLVRRLRPVNFDWKGGGVADLGLIAEEVAAVEPLLATTNKEGEIQGVKYDRIGVVLINAVNEQQAQIEAQQKEIERLKEENARRQKEFEELKIIMCASNPQARVCKQ